MITLKRKLKNNKPIFHPITISVVMTIYGDEPYLNLAIDSIINYVNEIIIVINNSESQIPENPKIKKFNVEPITLRHQAFEFGVTKTSNDWVMRWDADFVAYPNINELFQKITSQIDCIYFYGIQPYGDLKHRNKNFFKINDCWIGKKSGISNIVYANNPDKDSYYFISLSYVRSFDTLIFKHYKNEYWTHVAIIKELIPFKNFLEDVKKKGHVATKDFLRRNCFLDLSKHTFPIPTNIPEKYKIIEEPLYHHITLNTTKETKRDEITLIVLVRNTHKYLDECLNSVYNQTSQRWRVLIINDTPEIPINVFHPKVKVINLKNWNGLVKGHKLAMMNVETPIIGILDSDDTLHPDAVEAVLQIYDNNEDDIFVYSNFCYCNMKLEPLGYGYCAPIRNSVLQDRCANPFRTFKTIHYFMTEGYDDDLCFGAEDQDILIKLEEFAKPIYLDRLLYLYRTIGSNSISSLKNLSELSLQISIIKNITKRFGSLEPVLNIYSKENVPDINSTSNYFYETSEVILNEIKYYFEISSHGIMIARIDFELNKNFILSVINEKSVPVSIEYSNLNKWIVSSVGKPFDIKSITIIRPNFYFDNIYSLENLDVDFIYKKIENKEDAIKEAKNKGYKKIMIIENKIKQHFEFKSRFNEFIRNIPYDWYKLNLGGNVIAYDKLVLDKLDVSERVYECKLFQTV